MVEEQFRANRAIESVGKEIQIPKILICGDHAVVIGSHVAAEGAGIRAVDKQVRVVEYGEIRLIVFQYVDWNLRRIEPGMTHRQLRLHGEGVHIHHQFHSGREPRSDEIFRKGDVQYSDGIEIVFHDGYVVWKHHGGWGTLQAVGRLTECDRASCQRCIILLHENGRSERIDGDDLIGVHTTHGKPIDRVQKGGIAGRTAVILAFQIPIVPSGWQIEFHGIFIRDGERVKNGQIGEGKGIERPRLCSPTTCDLKQFICAGGCGVASDPIDEQRHHEGRIRTDRVVSGDQRGLHQSDGFISSKQGMIVDSSRYKRLVS